MSSTRKAEQSRVHSSRMEDVLREIKGEAVLEESKRSDFFTLPIYTLPWRKAITGDRETDRSLFRTGVKTDPLLFTNELRVEEMDWRRLEIKSLSKDPSPSEMHSRGDMMTTSLDMLSLQFSLSGLSGRVYECCRFKLKSLRCNAGSVLPRSMTREESNPQQSKKRRTV